MILIPGSIYLLISIVLTKLFDLAARNTLLMDKPNERSLHVVPTVRGGGIVFIALSLFAIPLLSYFFHISFTENVLWMFCIALLATVSFIDDLYQLSTKSRFLVQCVVATLLVLFLKLSHLDFGLFVLHQPYLMMPFVFISTIWAINHFNFMDGIDGFCASQALFLFAAYGLFFNFHQAFFYEEFCIVLVFGLIGFLIFNFPPAKLFMGDVGSATLGFITFSLALIAQQKYQIPILYWFILNALFLFDATITLIRRILHHEKWHAPHRKHAYQRLKQFGTNTRIILLGQMIINLMLLTLLLLYNANRINSMALLSMTLTMLITGYLFIEQLFPMYPKKD